MFIVEDDDGDGIEIVAKVGVAAAVDTRSEAGGWLKSACAEFVVVCERFAAVVEFKTVDDDDSMLAPVELSARAD
jgi:hypothetical protein